MRPVCCADPSGVVHRFRSPKAAAVYLTEATGKSVSEYFVRRAAVDCGPLLGYVVGYDDYDGSEDVSKRTSEPVIDGLGDEEKVMETSLTRTGAIRSSGDARDRYYSSVSLLRVCRSRACSHTSRASTGTTWQMGSDLLASA